MLAIRNPHLRDQFIKFYEEGHIYKVLTDPTHHYTSVTTFIHSLFPKFDADKVIDSMMKSKNWNENNKYWGMTKQEIKKLWNSNKNIVAQSGTDLHYMIECFNNDIPNIEDNKEVNDLNYSHYYHNYSINDNNKNLDCIEWRYFINFVNNNQHLIPYRTEWVIYDEESKIAGSIDMVYKNNDNSYSIYDWKRCKIITKINNFDKFAIPEVINNLPDANFWHYSLQLNTYKYILEKNYQISIRDLFLVKLHPNNDNNDYELIEVPNLQEQVKILFDNIIRKKK